MTTQKRIIAARYAVIFACAAFVAVAGVPGLAFKLWRERRRPSEEWRKDQEMYELLGFTEDAHTECKKEIERLRDALETEKKKKGHVDLSGYNHVARMPMFRCEWCGAIAPVGDKFKAVIGADYRNHRAEVIKYYCAGKCWDDAIQAMRRK